MASIAILFVHFFEEFGWPGGFAYMGMKVMMHSDEPDCRKWGVNSLSSMFGNWGFLLLLYVLPLCLPGVRFLTLSAFMFLFAELFMHWLLFPIALRTSYNAGQITALLLGIIGIYYFFLGGGFDGSILAWYDWVLAIVWFIIVFMFCFRSKLYWDLGKKPGYDMKEECAYGPFKNFTN